MLDAKAWHALQRSVGDADLRLDASSTGAVRIAKLRQQGSAKVFLPKGAPHEGVFLNTSGGLTGGDRLSFSLHLGTGLAFTATTQTAERVYASSCGAAAVDVNLTAGAGAGLAWLPQETILYEASELNRATTVSLEQGATALISEAVILGRHAMHEDPVNLHFTDVRRVYMAGRLVWSEAIRLHPAQLARRHEPALLNGARCFATIAMIGQGVESGASALSALLEGDGCETAMSAWNGKLILRLRARHSWPLRCQIACILTQLRGKPLPRVWQMNGDIL